MGGKGLQASLATLSLLAGEAHKSSPDLRKGMVIGAKQL
jgi:hypothetical protein